MSSHPVSHLVSLLLTAAASTAAVAAPAAVQSPAAAADSAAPAASADSSTYARLPFCTLSKDGTRLAVEPCRTAPAKSPMPRRPVTEIITPMPRVARAPAAAAPPLPSLSAPSSGSRPQPLVGCGAGSCLDANGVRRSVGGSNVTVTPSGKLCNINGIWMQCS